MSELSLEIVNKTQARLPQAFLNAWVGSVARELSRLEIGPFAGSPKTKKSATKASKKRKKLDYAVITLTAVFVSKPEMKKLNRQFRGKDYATDVLSFEGQPSDFGGLSFHGEEKNLGELVLCLDVIKKNAVEHGLSLKEELGYMILHGILHLLGYDHETSKRDAEKMFQLQDEIFEKLRE